MRAVKWLALVIALAGCDLYLDRSRRVPVPDAFIIYDSRGACPTELPHGQCSAEQPTCTYGSNVCTCHNSTWLCCENAACPHDR